MIHILLHNSCAIKQKVYAATGKAICTKSAPSKGVRGGDTNRARDEVAKRDWDHILPHELSEVHVKARNVSASCRQRQW